MKFNTRTWIQSKKTSLYLKSPGFTNKFSYIKSSVIAIVIGLTLGCLTVYATGGNGIAYITTMFVEAFSTFGSKTDNQFSITMNYMVVFIFMGLGLALGFKVGLFNMGGSGQAVFGFASTFLILRNIAQNRGVAITSLEPGLMVMVFIVFVLCGVIISVITGLLKVFFNIHEVATSIMLNWIIWYIMKWLINDTNANLVRQNWLAVGDNTWIIGMILALLSVAVTWFVLAYTTIGYKFNMVGRQKTAAKYAGVNSNLFIIMTTACQGLFISLGGIFYFYNVQKQMSLYNDVIPTIGFDAISVALVAFNNVIGIIPIALLWAIMSSGAPSAADEAMTSQELSSVITGVIMYCATIYVLFMRFKPWLLIKKKSYINSDLGLRNLLKLNQDKISENKTWLKQVSTSAYIVDLKAQTEQKVTELNNQLVVVKQEYLNNLKSEAYQQKLAVGLAKINELKQQLVDLKVQTKVDITNKKVQETEVLNKKIAKMKAIEQINLNSITELKTQLEALKANQSEVAAEQKAHLKAEIKILKGNKIMFKSSIIEYKTDFKHLMVDYIEEKSNPIEDLKFKIQNAKWKISKEYFKRDVLALENEIKKTKQIFKEEVLNEKTKYHKVIVELEFENKELIEKGFFKYYNSGLYGIKNYFKGQKRDALLVVLNQAVIDESAVTLEISNLKKAYKTKTSSLSKEALLEQVKTLRTNLNTKYDQKVKDLNVFVSTKDAELKAALASAGEKIKTYKAEYKNQITTSTDVNVKKASKELLFQRIAEVQNDYINA